MIGRMSRERRTTIAGRPVRYLEAGKGRPLVLLHAFPFSADLWQAQVERPPDGWRLIAPDLRGFGPGSSDASAGSMDDHAGDVIGLMDALRIEQAVIGGISMGGYVTFALFRQAPERFAGMILADTKAQADTPVARAGRRAMSDLLHSKGLSAVVDGLLPKLLGETTRRERPELVAAARRLIEANHPAGIDQALHALMTRPDSTPDLGRIRCRSLVIVGQEDTVTPTADAELLARTIPGAALVVLPGAGHVSNFEAPEAFSNVLATFLSRAF
jgi:pimeloyl-ACP methyl ester carboxylesterase